MAVSGICFRFINKRKLLPVVSYDIKGMACERIIPLHALNSMHVLPTNQDIHTKKGQFPEIMPHVSQSVRSFDQSIFRNPAERLYNRI